MIFKLMIDKYEELIHIENSSSEQIEELNEIEMYFDGMYFDGLSKIFSPELRVKLQNLKLLKLSKKT